MTVILFASSVLTARLLGPTGRGLFSGVLLIGMLSGQVAQLGLAPSFVYHVGAGSAFGYGRLLASSLIAVCAVAVLLAAGGLYYYADTQLIEAWPLVILLAIFTALQSYFLVLAQLRANLHFLNGLRLFFVAGNLFLLGALALVANSIGFEDVVAVQIVVLALLSVAGAVWAIRHRVWRVDFRAARASLRQVLSYALYTYGSGVTTTLAANFDKIVLLKLGTVTQFGFYTLAFSVSRLIGSVQDAVSTNLFARFAGKDIGALDRSVRTSFTMTFLPLLILAALGALISPWVIASVYGSSFRPIAVPFAILLFECVISGASANLAQRFNAAGTPGLVFARQMLSIVPLIVGIPFLTVDNALVLLPSLMLLCAIIRLAMTMALYHYVLKEPVPKFRPSADDLEAASKLLTRGYWGVST
jgi:enterobacterial common antigen flippase